eukprot:3018028-Prorocentrum_lima.AAC.1
MRSRACDPDECPSGCLSYLRSPKNNKFRPPLLRKARAPLYLTLPLFLLHVRQTLSPSAFS